MLTRRAILTAIGVLSLGACTQAPVLPPITAFLKHFQLMDRDGKVLPAEWTISQSQPLDPTIQFDAVDVPTVLEDRKVLPPDRWIIMVDVRDEHDTSQWGELLRDQNVYAEETIGVSGPLVWESPDVPKTLPKSVAWHWCHLRIPDAGKYTLVFKLYPSAYQLANTPNHDYGSGIELARQTVIVEPGPKPVGGLVLSVKSGKELNRTAWRKMRPKLKLDSVAPPN